jgi:hypothetical protein
MSLLHKTEKDGRTTATYLSSNILKSEYDKNKNELEVIFKGGGRYLYEDVSVTDYIRFETAESQGKVLNTNIKSKPFTKLESVDSKPIEESVEELKNVYVSELCSEGVDSILNLINSTDEYDAEIFDKIIKRSHDVLEIIKQYK